MMRLGRAVREPPKAPASIAPGFNLAHAGLKGSTVAAASDRGRAVGTPPPQKAERRMTRMAGVGAFPAAFFLLPGKMRARIAHAVW